MRLASIPVAVTDDLDAMRAATVIDLADRSQFREALAATTVKSAAHRATFDALFDVYFPARAGIEGLSAPRDIDPFLVDVVDRVLDVPAEGFLCLIGSPVGDQCCQLSVFGDDMVRSAAEPQ